MSYMGAGAANSTGKRHLSRVNLCVLRPRQPNLPLRIGNFDSAGAEFRQQLDTYVRAHVLTATLRILDPETQFEVDAAIGPFCDLRSRLRIAQHARMPGCHFYQ